MKKAVIYLRVSTKDQERELFYPFSDTYSKKLF